MGLTHSEMDRLLDGHFRYEATGDIEGVLSTLTSDAIHDIVGWPTGPTTGRENIRPFYQPLFGDLEGSSARCVKRLYGDNFVVDESVCLVQGGLPSKPNGLLTMARSSVKTRGSTWLH